MVAMWGKEGIDTSKLREGNSIEGKYRNRQYVKAKKLQCQRMFERLKYNVNRPKNNKMYLFLVLDDFDNINLLQKFEVDYLKMKAEDITLSIRSLEGGVGLTAVERQLNVKKEFLDFIKEHDLLRKVKEYERERNTVTTVSGARFTETYELSKEYYDNEVKIVGDIRDGYTTNEALDEVGSMFNTREWTAFYKELERRGVELRHNDKLRDVIELMVSGYSIIDIEVELNFTNELQKEVCRETRKLDFKLRLGSIKDEDIKKYQTNLVKGNNTVEIPITIEAVKEEISKLKGYELLEYLGAYIEERDIEDLVN